MLSVEAVSKTFGGVQALRDATRSCAAGVLLGLIGQGAEACARAGIGRTFQNIRLFKDLTVRQNVEVAHITCQAVRPDKAARIGIDQLLAQYELDGFADFAAGTLPYGSQRRLEIARALAL